MGRVHTIEEAPELDVHKLAVLTESGEQPRRTGRLFLRHGVRLQYRVDLTTQRLTCRVGHEPWESVRLERAPRSRMWRALCPTCLSPTELLYWPITTSRGRGLCRDCHQLRYKQATLLGKQPLRYDIRAGNLEPVLRAIQSGGPAAIKARQAMEQEGLVPRMLSLEDGWTRRRKSRKKADNAGAKKIKEK